jgi:biopolymer transport protein ExbD
MPKVKVARKSTATDMTAMCDVAFLLLNFFMLTTQFKAPESAPISMPSSISEIKLPETDIMTITITKEGKVLFAIDNKHHSREALLQRIADKFNLQFTPEETKAFVLSSGVSVPVSELKGWLGLSEFERKNYPYKGIPIDSTNNELGMWIMQGRISNPGLRIAISGDGDCPYPVVKKVMNTLQDKNVNKFNLITNLEENPNKKS